MMVLKYHVQKLMHVAILPFLSIKPESIRYIPSAP